MTTTRSDPLSAAPLARLDCVSYQYPRATAPALRNVTLELHPGEFVGLIGPTGAGKTTLCLTLNGIVPQAHGGRFFGRVTVAGLDTVEQPVSELARHVGLVFEDPETQLVTTSVENEVAFALENLGFPRAEIRARLTWALQAVGLSGLEQRPPHTLSGGQKQRLAIAAALALRPALLVLDEPTSQLDPAGAQEVFATVRALNRELGVTVLLVSHAAEELAEHADRLALLANGELVAVGTPAEIYGDVARLEACALRPPQVTRLVTLLSLPPAAPVPVRLAEGETYVQALAATRPRPSPPPPSPPPSRAGPPLIAVRDLHYRYPDGTEALRGVSLELHAGEYLLLAGANGAGKSTLVRHFLGLLHPTVGSVTIDGVETRTLKTSRLARRIGYVAQNPARQLFNATVSAEVSYALRLAQFPPAEVEARVTASLAALNLLAVRHRHPLTLPRGDQARVVIAALLALQPEIFIFDEPTTGQDEQGAQAILELTRRLHRQGHTIIVITHQLHLMPAYAERMVIMDRGTLLLDAPLRQALHATEVLRAASLTPPQAVLLAQVLERQTGQPWPFLTPEELAAALGGPQEPQG